MNFEKELLKLERELQDHTYKPGRSICFVVTDPKPREIFAADFRDRVVHHLLVNYIELIWEKKFIHHSYSCRQNKGAHRAVKDLKRFLRKVTASSESPLGTLMKREPAYYLQADVSAFFMSLRKDILFNLIRRHLKNSELLWLAESIIFQDPTENFYYKGDFRLHRLIPDHKSLFKIPKNQGLPIGNLTSQFFANVYLNELDQFIKHDLKCRYYLRYVDDIILLNQDANQLKLWQWQIDNFLQEKLKLHLHPQKSTLQPIHRGMNFVGFIVKPKYNLVRNRTVKKFKSKLWHFDQKIISLNLEHPIRLWTPKLCDDFKEIFATVNSYYGQFRHANTFRLRRHLYYKHFKILKIYLKPVDKNYSYMAWDED